MNLGHLVVVEWKRTLIIVRRALAELKTALAGVVFETSFAGFVASIAIFNEEGVVLPTRSLGLGSRGSESM